MKIIKEGDKNKAVRVYTLTCHCGCVAEFTAEEIQNDRDGQYIICPTCGSYIDINSPYIKLTAIEIHYP